MNYSIVINQLAGETHFPGLDIIDLAIYDYIKGFYPNAEKYSDTLGLWFWVSHKKLITDMPVLKIKSKAGIIKRINNLVDSKILERHPESQKLGKSFYKIGDKWDLLTKVYTSQQKSTGTHNENQEPPHNENQDNYNTIYDPFTIIHSKNKEVQDLFIEYLTLRKKEKLSNSEVVIKRLLNKLHEYATNTDEAKEVISKAITCKWKDFYPLKDNEKKTSKIDTNPSPEEITQQSIYDR